MADTTIKLSGTYDSIEAYQILEDCRSVKTDVETAETTATNAATAAQGYANSASTYAGNASTYATNASTYADNASDSADDAADSAANASTSETNAATSETNASNSASAAATSESNAATSATNAHNSELAAAASAAEVEAALDDYLPLAGGTMTGNLTIADEALKVSYTTDNVDGYLRANGWGTVITVDSYDYNQAGAKLTLNTKNANSTNNGNGLGDFTIAADDGTNSKRIEGKPDGTLTWGGKNILTDATVGTVVTKSISSSVSLSANTGKTITSISLAKGTWVVTGHADFTSVTTGNAYGASIGDTANRVSYADEGTANVHSSSGKGVSITPVMVMKLNATTTVYLCGLSSASATVSYAHLTAVRIV